MAIRKKTLFSCFGQETAGPGNPVTESWERRLQRVQMRTKIVVPMVLLAVLPALAIGTFIIWRAREILQESVVRRVQFDTASKARTIEDFLSSLENDVGFLSQSKTIRDLVSAGATSNLNHFSALRQEAERDFLFFQRAHPYCQAQCLSALGQQLIRLNANGEILQVVPEGRVEDLSDRFYVKAAAVLRPGQVYISPMHLDMVHGMLGPVVKFVTRVLASEGPGHGLLVVEVCADHVLSRIGPLPAGMEAWLVDETGGYLGYVGSSPKKRAAYTLEKHRKLSQDYSSTQLAALLGHRQSGLVPHGANALVFRASISLHSGATAGYWQLLISHPRAPVVAPIWRLTAFLSLVTLLAVVVSGILGIFITHYLARPVASLRRATREIAAGDLTRRVEITTGDEIEALAADFNIMTERLSEAQLRLSQWNTELEREVSRQTEKIRQFQAGMARADKLASIGQITAGVMHEIGNPLAAIKTKIQVAEESGDLTPAEQEVFKEVMAEVDRLARFLRSFSRLARLREQPVREKMSLTEVASGVVALLAPDFKRRRMKLRCDWSEKVPPMRGDPEQLRHLLMNLVLNAADASADGQEIVIRIQGPASEAASGSPDGLVTLQVLDHGSGIKPEILEAIWNPFFTTKPEGTGLGLAISRQIVQEHGATIQVQSEPGKGTLVTVLFPEFFELSSAMPREADEPDLAVSPA